MLTGDPLAAGRSATFSGQVNPNGEAVSYHFEYGRTTAVRDPHTRRPRCRPATTSPTPAPTSSGSPPDTTYHVRLVATSASGTRSGDDDTFATDQPGPSVATGSAGAITGYAASIAGTVDPNGLATTYRFEYGPTTAYGSVTATQSLAAGYRTGAVSASLAGLLPGRSYHYRVAATNASGTRYGDDATLATTALPPDVTTGAASGLGTPHGHRRAAGQPERRRHLVPHRVRPDDGLPAAGGRHRRRLGHRRRDRDAVAHRAGPGHALPLPGRRRERRGETAGQDATFRTVALHGAAARRASR